MERAIDLPPLAITPRFPTARTVFRKAFFSLAMRTRYLHFGITVLTASSEIQKIRKIGCLDWRKSVWTS
jgi:hypothetical protein